MPKPDDQASQTTGQTTAAEAPAPVAAAPAKLSPPDALKRLPKGTTVVVPVIDPKTGQRAFSKDPQTRVRKYASQEVPIAAAHILAVGKDQVVTVDGRKIRFAA